MCQKKIGEEEEEAAARRLPLTFALTKCVENRLEMEGGRTMESGSGDVAILQLQLTAGNLSGRADGQRQLPLPPDRAGDRRQIGH